MAVFLDMHPLNKPEVLVTSAYDKFDKAGKLTDEPTKKVLATFVVALLDWTIRLKNRLFRDPVQRRGPSTWVGPATVVAVDRSDPLRVERDGVASMKRQSAVDVTHRLCAFLQVRPNRRLIWIWSSRRC
jgi:hypothetical protein